MPPQRLWADYLASEPADLLRRLCEVTQELSGLHQEHAMVRGSEKQAKVMGFAHSQAQSVTAREKEGDYNALNTTVTVFSLQGQISALQEEQTLLQLLIGLKASLAVPS